MKKFLSVLLIAALAMTMFSIPAMAETTTLKVMLWDRGDAPAGGTVENSKMTTYINEQIADLGIQVEFVSTPRSGSDDKLVTWMGGSSAPDIIFTYGQSTFLNFATQGGLVDLAPSIAKLGPDNNIEKYVGDVMNMGNIDGKQYALLSKRGAANPRHTAYIRKDWLDELGLKMPTTKEELIDVLYKFKEAKPDCIPWAMNGRTDTEKTYLNFVGSYVDFADEKDQYTYSEGYIVMHDGALEGIKTLNKLYNDGLSKGREEGERLLEEARSQAGEIIAKARKEAEDIVSEARRQADDYSQKVKSDLKMAAAQSFQATKSDIENLIIGKFAGEEVKSTLSSADFVKQFLQAIAEKFSTDDASDLSVVLPASLQDELEPFVKGQLSKVLGKEISASFSKKLSGGFTIGPKDGGYFISMTDETFNELITEYLRPVTKRLLFG